MRKLTSTVVLIFLQIDTLTTGFMVHRLSTNKKQIGFFNRNDKYTFDEGNKKCQSLKFDGLFTLTSQEEAAEFMELMKRFKPTNSSMSDEHHRQQGVGFDSWNHEPVMYWQAVRREFKEYIRDPHDGWVSLASKKSPVYQPWDYGYPTNDEMENCVVLSYQCSDDCTLSWLHDDCEDGFPIICEKRYRNESHTHQNHTNHKEEHHSLHMHQFSNNGTNSSAILEVETKTLFNLIKNETETLFESNIKKHLNSFSRLSRIVSHDMNIRVSESTFQLALEIAQSLYEHYGNLTYHTKPSESLETLVQAKQSTKVTKTLENLLSRVNTSANSTVAKFATKSLIAEVHYVSNTTEDISFVRSDGQTKILIPAEALRRSELVSRNNQTKVTFISYNTDVLFPSSHKAVGVISAQVDQIPITGLKTPVTYSFSLKQKFSNKEIRFLQCVSWNYDNLSWSNDGCSLDQNMTIPVCHCNHLTNFALLVQIHHRPIKPTILFNRIFSIIGSVSCVGFFLTAVIFLSYRELRQSPPGPLHIHLSICLLFGFLAMMIGADYTDNKNRCIAIAASIHYFMLAGWLWMLAHGVSMYKLLVRKHQSLDESFLTYATMFAYFLPGIVVGTTLGITVGYFDQRQLIKNWTRFDTKGVYESHYVSNSFCWIKGDALYFGYFTIQGFIAAANTLICFLVVRSITWGRRKIQSNKKTMKPLQQVCVIFTITFLLGLVWIIAIPLDLLGDIPLLTESISYIVSLLISIQGIVMFYLFCVRNKMARKLWATSFARLLVNIPYCGMGLERCWMCCCKVKTVELRYRRRSINSSNISKNSFRTPLPSTDSATSTMNTDKSTVTLSIRKTLSNMAIKVIRKNKISDASPTPTPVLPPRPMIDLHLTDKPDWCINTSLDKFANI